MEIKEAASFMISAENKPGTLAAFASKMKQANCDLAGLWGWGEGNQAGIIALPKNPSQFRDAAKKSGYTAKESRCFQVTGEDRVGALNDALDRIAKQQISLMAVNAITYNGRFTAVVWPETKDADTVGKLLKG